MANISDEGGSTTVVGIVRVGDRQITLKPIATTQSSEWLFGVLSEVLTEIQGFSTQVDFACTYLSNVSMVVPVHGFEQKTMDKWGLNQLASELVGHDIYGPVVLFKNKAGNLVDLKERHLVDKRCRACGTHHSRHKCGRCYKVYYCSKDCQKNDWRSHKLDCFVGEK